MSTVETNNKRINTLVEEQTSISKPMSENQQSNLKQIENNYIKSSNRVGAELNTTIDEASDNRKRLTDKLFDCITPMINKEDIISYNFDTTFITILTDKERVELRLRDIRKSIVLTLETKKSYEQIPLDLYMYYNKQFIELKLAVRKKKQQLLKNKITCEYSLMHLSVLNEHPALRAEIMEHNIITPDLALKLQQEGKATEIF
jgi:hypothetical protein